LVFSIWDGIHGKYMLDMGYLNLGRLVSYIES
jgi:hypothetical protein